MRAPNGTLDTILETIGGTPLVRLPRGFDPEVKCEVLLKCEFLNPGGSIKDRIALHMVREAERKGLLKKGGRIVECSSGNTGAGLCIVAAVLGYDITIVIPDKMSSEKIAAIEALGADVVVTSAIAEIDSEEHYTKVAERIAKQTPGAWWPSQYHNPDNTDAHYVSTGPEIWEQCDGRIDAFVAGAGTGGTLSGIAKYLKEQDPKIQIVGVDPPGSILYDYFKTGKFVEPGPYAVEGVGEEEIPGAWIQDVIDDYLQVTDTESFAMARRLAAETGIFGGGSSGMNLHAALEVARGLPADARVVTVLPDYGKAYLSKVYNQDWLRDWGYLPATPASTATVADLMHPQVGAAWVGKQDDLAWALRQAGEKAYRPLPVLEAEEGPLLGVLDESAALSALAQGIDPATASVADFVAAAPPVLAADAPWQNATAALADHESVLVRTARGWEGLNRRDLMQTLRRLNHEA